MNANIDNNQTAGLVLYQPDETDVAIRRKRRKGRRRRRRSSWHEIKLMDG